MEFARITNRHTAEALAWLVDEDISAVQREEEMATEVAEIDQLIEEMDRELAAAERIEWMRVSRSFTDHIRAQRAKRRAERVALRTLPVRLDATAHESESEAA